MTKDLRGGDVSLFRVELDGKHDYEYFEVTVQRPPDPGAPRASCPTPSVEYRGLIERRGRTETVRWLTTAATCGQSAQTMEVVGAVRGADGVRMVVEYSGDDWQSFAIVNPLGPASQFRSASRAAASPLRH